MSFELEDENVKLSLFFKLGFHESQLKRILDKIEDFEIIGEKLDSKVGDIQFGPVLIKLGSLTVEDNIYDFKYNHDRYLLIIEGKLDNLYEILQKIITAFNDDYKLEKICRFIEFFLSGLILDQNLAIKLSKKINIDKQKDLENAFNQSLIPSSIELRSSIQPTDNDWFSINLSPETMSTSSRLFIKIIKRFDSDFSNMVDFLKDLLSLNEKILNWLDA